MLSLHPTRLVASAAGADDHDGSCVCCCVVVSCVSLLLFVVLAAAVSVSRACAITGAVVLLLGLVGWLAPTGSAGAGAGPAVSQQQQQQHHRQDQAPARVVRLVVHHHRCACGLADASIAALPTFAYQHTRKGGDDGSGGAGSDANTPRGSSVLCAVCLDDVRAGEMVRQLPACRHMFHVGCVDAWLRAHRTCPLCRCHLSPRNDGTTKGGDAAALAAAVTEASGDALPPV